MKPGEGSALGLEVAVEDHSRHGGGKWVFLGSNRHDMFGKARRLSPGFSRQLYGSSVLLLLFVCLFNFEGNLLID